MSISKCHNGSPFNDDDYQSGDGMLTSVWGPSLWHSMHVMSFNYPVKPTPEQKKHYLNFFLSLKHLLPCKYCRDNYKNNIKKVPLNMKTMKNRYTFSLWLYKLHEEINTMLGKKSNLTYEQVRDRYEIFRARCINDKKGTLKKKPKRKRGNTKCRNKNKLVKEKGCTNPLYGVKSKCVISIVPRNKKCKTFKIDDKCRIKRR